MRQHAAVLALAAIVSQVYAAPQFISFDDGKLGVNFGGYHAAVGLGGILGQTGGAGGGLFAEAGTPHGQAAKAGLGGNVGSNGAAAGGLYAGATAGGNVKAATGLAGGVTAEKSAGTGYAAAQAGNKYASAGLGGQASGAEASGFTFSGAKTFGLTSGNVGSASTFNAKPAQTVHKKVHKEFNVDADKDYNFVPLAQKSVTVKNEVPQVIVKEVSKVNSPNVLQSDEFYNDYFSRFIYQVPPMNYIRKMWWKPHYRNSYRNSQVYVQSPPQVIEKHIVHKHTKPRHHFRKTAYIGGYIGGNGEVQPQPAIEKRIDVGVNAAANAGASASANAAVAADAGAVGGVGQTYTKQVTFQRNPNFFADIFNIPISTLKAVGNLLGNTAGSTSVTVQKSGSIQSDADLITPKHAASSAIASSEAHVSVQTPNVSKVIDDIFAIPINTLGAVNKFLENNVPARKTVQVSADGTSEVGRARLGPHARRRANKQVIIVQEENMRKTETTETS